MTPVKTAAILPVQNMTHPVQIYTFDPSGIQLTRTKHDTEPRKQQTAPPAADLFGQYRVLFPALPDATRMLADRRNSTPYKL